MKNMGEAAAAAAQENTSELQKIENEVRGKNEAYSLQRMRCISNEGSQKNEIKKKKVAFFIFLPKGRQKSDNKNKNLIICHVWRDGEVSFVN